MLLTNRLVRLGRASARNAVQINKGCLAVPRAATSLPSMTPGAVMCSVKQTPCLGELGVGCCETPWFCQTQSELCSDLQPSPNKRLLPKITSGRSGCDWLCLWHCNLVQCQTLSYMELGLILPPP